MRIALYNITTTTRKGGIESFCWGLAKNLSKIGFEIDLYAGENNNTFQNQKNLKIITLPYIDRNKFPNFGSRFRKFMERLSFAYHALPVLRKNKYDFFCIFKPYDLPIAFLIKKMTNCKTIFFSGGTEFFIGYRSMIKGVDYFFSCSEFNAKQIEAYSKIKPLVLPNGIDTELFKPQEPATELKKKLGINEEKILITVCRLIGWKGVQYAIKAVKKVIDDGYKVKYLIIGDGDYRKTLERLVNSLNIGNHILFLGSIENFDLPKYYSISDIAIFPSIANETFGISIAEAMACGVPVISTNVGGIPEVVGDSGFLVSPCNEEEISNRIEILIADNSLRRELAIKGRRRIIENFSWNNIVTKFLEYINA